MKRSGRIDSLLSVPAEKISAPRRCFFAAENKSKEVLNHRGHRGHREIQFSLLGVLCALCGLAPLRSSSLFDFHPSWKAQADCS